MATAERNLTIPRPEDHSSTRERGVHLELVGVLAITAFAALIRWASIRRGLWLDELTTAWVVRDSLSDILPRSFLNNLSPLYYWPIWAATRLAGYNEVGLRLPSFLAGIAIIPTIYFLARALTGSRSLAFLSATIATVDGTFLWYSVESRPYSAVQLFALLNIYLLVRYFDERSRRFAFAMALNAAVLFYLHYTTALFFGVNILILVVGWIRGPGPSRKELSVLAVASAMFCILIVPALAQLFYLVSNRGIIGSFINPISPEASILRFNIERYGILSLTIAAVTAYALGRRDNSVETKPAVSRAVVMLLLWLLVPPLTSWALGKAHLVQLNIDRYVIASSTACVLLPGVATCSLCTGRRARNVTFVLLMLLTIWGSRNVLHDISTPEKRRTTEGHRQWRDLVTRLNRDAPRGLPIFLKSDLVESEFLSQRNDPLLQDYLLCPVNSAYPLFPDLLPNARPVNKLESLADSEYPDGFVFIGSTKLQKQLEAVSAGIARRRRTGFQVRFLTGNEFPEMKLIAVVVSFEPIR